MSNILLLSGAKHLHKPLQEAIFKRNLRFSIHEVDHVYFPDTEQYVRIPVEKGLPNIVIQSMYSEPDRRIIESILATRTLKDLGVNYLIGFFTYLAYARQDRRIKEGEAISQKIIIECLFNAGIDKAYVFEIHTRNESALFKNFNITNLSCVKLFADYYVEFKGRKDLKIISPDSGSYNMASELAKLLEVNSGFCSKKRISGSEVKVGEVSTEVNGYDVILIDDIISTGNTMSEAIELLRNKGAVNIFVTATHGLFVGNAVDKLKSLKVKDIVTTNTVMNEFAKIDISGMIVDEISKLENHVKH
jgi:ribose-phosphate pyrophosphokinase